MAYIAMAYIVWSVQPQASLFRRYLGDATPKPAAPPILAVDAGTCGAETRTRRHAGVLILAMLSRPLLKSRSILPAPTRLSQQCRPPCEGERLSCFREAPRPSPHAGPERIRQRAPPPHSRPPPPLPQCPQSSPCLGPPTRCCQPSRLRPERGLTTTSNSSSRLLSSTFPVMDRLPVLDFRVRFTRVGCSAAIFD